MKDQPTEHLSADSLRGTQGEVEDRDVSITFGGACPVQGYGTVLGEFPCYYRARGSSWQFEVYEAGTDLEDGLDSERSLFEIAECPYPWPDAGWLAAAESVANIRRGVAAFLVRHAQGVRHGSYKAGVSSQRTLERSDAQEPHPRDAEVDQRLAELRWRLVGIDLGKLLQDGTRIALDLHKTQDVVGGPGLDASDLRAALVRGLGYGLRGDLRGVVDIASELEALARMAGEPLVSPES